MNSVKKDISEILDIVDKQDQIVGQASHAKVHKEKLMHRVVSALLFNSRSEVLLQLRAKTKSAYPSMWSFSMGGHVRHGETYVQAIVRESHEEVGVALSKKDFTYVGTTMLTEHSQASVIHHLYTVIYDGPIQETTEEVDGVQFVDFPTLRRMIQTEKEKFHPQLLVILQGFFSKELSSDLS